MVSLESYSDSSIPDEDDKVGVQLCTYESESRTYEPDARFFEQHPSVFLNSDDDDISTEEQDDSWCTCGRCDKKENNAVCCHSIAGIIGGKFGSEICITSTSGFQQVCLSRNVLEAALGTWCHFTDQPLEISNTSYMFIACRQFASWVYGWLGKHVGKIIPSCVGSKIQKSFPVDEKYA